MTEDEEVRLELQKHRGPEDDSIVFSYGDLTFGFNVRDLDARSAEAYLDLQQRKIIGSFEDIKGKRVLVFEGGPPNLIIIGPDGTVKPSYWPPEELEARGFVSDPG